ncbi:MAG: DUF4258 domain-containing protein [Halobacteriota archaeon]
MKIVFTDHASDKFSVLRKHNCKIDKESVLKAVKDPEKVVPGKHYRLIAQKALDEEHLLRVIYEDKGKEWVIITFYPARRERYED